jgi:hypothetical protein
LLSIGQHAPVPSPLKLFQHSQKLKVSHSEAHLPAILAHFWSSYTRHIQPFFKSIIPITNLQGLQCFCSTVS